MNFRRARRFAPLFLAWMTLASCTKDKTLPTSTASSRALDPSQAAPAASCAPSWCIRALEVEDATPPRARISKLWSPMRRETLAAAIEAIDGVVAVSRGSARPADPSCSPDAPKEAQIGLALRFEYRLLDGERQPQLPGPKLQPGQLTFAVTAHVERLGIDGRPELAEASPHGSVPMPQRRLSAIASFASLRLVRAAKLATADALGQLWMRHLDNPRVLGLLKEKNPWRRAAAIRETGERQLSAGREAIEEAAGDSRREVAVVAAAALGRLGDPRSLPALEGCLEARDLEVVDAALTALADMPDPKARALLQAATHHPRPWIRQRASSLLER